MNQIPPELKRLLHWARQAPAPPADQAPFGFSRRVVNIWLTERPVDPLWIWQRAIWNSGCAAALVILLGLAVLTIQRFGHKSPYDVSPAYELVSTELVP
ncbi:MAG TPA: hypothetical protein VFE51_30675 [Verrucomicrobiae bacterium]|nr:hypothetical protein [Verrucomicrobiae bacterium]